MADEPTPNLEASAEKPEPTQPAGPPPDAGPRPAGPASAEAPDSPPASAGEAVEAKGKEAGEKPGPGGEKRPPESGEAEGKKKDEKRDIFAEIMGEEGAESLKIFKAKASKHVTKGIVHIIATFNNTVVTITDTKGNSIGWSSSAAAMPTG